MDSIKDLIIGAIPNISENDLQLYFDEFLNMGVESKSDLKHLEQHELGFMKLMHAKKLISAVKGKYTYVC